MGGYDNWHLQADSGAAWLGALLLLALLLAGVLALIVLLGRPTMPSERSARRRSGDAGAPTEDTGHARPVDDDGEITAREVVAVPHQRGETSVRSR